MKIQTDNKYQYLAWSPDNHESPTRDLISKQLSKDNLQWQECSDIFDFLETHANTNETNIILANALTKYSSEANYRHSIARLFESGTPNSAAIIIEQQNNPRIPILFRALRALGIENLIDSALLDNHLIIKITRDLDLLKISKWRQDPAPYLSRPSEKETIEKIITSIKTKSRLSLIRVGHCEVRFVGQNFLYGDSDLKKSSEIQWGATPPTPFIQKVQSDLKLAITNGSILGFKNRSSFSSRSLKVLDNSVLHCLSSLSLLRAGHIQTSPNIHFSLGESIEFISALKDSEHIIIISPRSNVYERLKSICPSNTKIDFLPLPGEARIDGPYDIENRIQRFHETEIKLKGISKKGSVALVGAGVAGKIFCEIARSNGGIGLDLGSTLDAWAGIDSRGSGFSMSIKNALA